MGRTDRRSRGRQAWSQRSVAAALGLVLAVALGCTPQPGAPPADPPRARLSDCPRLDASDVVGRPPAYLPAGADLAALPIQGAVCAGLWAPRRAAAFVPQGVAVRGRTAWLTGYDEGPPGALWCRVLRVDLRTGRLLADRPRLTGRVGGGAETACRHGGGVALDEHGLWLTESSRLWLLDPGTLAVRRAWRLTDPVQGSFGVLDGRGRIGLGRFRPSRVHPGRAALDWFRVEDLLAPGRVELGTADAAASRSIPSHAQGAVWARFGGRTGVWFARSHTRCGVLEGPGGSVSFVPGAEGMALTEDGLWVVSESTARPFWTQGGRPVVPTLTLLDPARIGTWPEPACDPAD